MGTLATGCGLALLLLDPDVSVRPHVYLRTGTAQFETSVFAVAAIFFSHQREVRANFAATGLQPSLDVGIGGDV